MAYSSMMSNPSLSSLNTPRGQPKFVNKLTERNLCIKCHNILRNALQTPCGHRLCENCVVELFELGEKQSFVACPANEEDCESLTKGNLYPDASARREVLKLMVYCSFQPYGCPAQVRWKDLQEHESSCEYVPLDCKNRKFGCMEKIPKLELQKHETQTCQYRQVGCKICGEMIPVINQRQHESNECPKAMINCPHNCGMTSFRREELSAHYENCPARPVRCSFAEYGCIYEGSQTSIEHHNRENMETHLKLLVEGISRKDLIINELRIKNADIENEFDQLKQRIAEGEEDMKSLGDKVTDSQSKIRNLQKMIAHQSDEIARLDKKSTGAISQEQLDRQAADILTMKEKQTAQEQRIARAERGGTGAVNIDPIKTQVNGHEKQLGLYDMRLAEVDLRFQVLETASYDGVLIWKIRDYARRKQEAVDGRTYSLYSQPFYTSRYGYKMCARVYLNGDGMGKNTHLSLFFVIMRGDCDALLQWPFKQKVTLMLLDQETGRNTLSDTFRPDANSSSFKRPATNMNIASGCPMFVSQAVLHSGKYIKDDTLFIKILVETADLYPI